jgi:hypothetical protein
METSYIFAIVHLALLVVYLILFRHVALKKRLLALYPLGIGLIITIVNGVEFRPSLENLVNMGPLPYAIVQALLIQASSYAGAYCFSKRWDTQAIMVLFMGFASSMCLAAHAFH